MSKAWELFQQFRGSRAANILGALLFLMVGLYNIAIEPSVVSLILGILFLIIGMLGLYNQLLGEPVTETVKRRL